MEATTIDSCSSIHLIRGGSSFDIRPLQEFFAAEYIYELVSAEKLSERIRVIALDSHWREVMHFLLSALVENGRQTELSVVVRRSPR